MLRTFGSACKTIFKNSSGNRRMAALQQIVDNNERAQALLESIKSEVSNGSDSVP